MMADTRYLKRRRQGWYFRIAVPAYLRDKLKPGKVVSEIVETLGTSDIKAAQSLRWARREHWEREFQRLRGEPVTAAIRPPREVYQETIREAVELDLAPWSDPEQTGSDIDLERDAILTEAMRRAGVRTEEELGELPLDLQARLDALADYVEIRQGRKPRLRDHYRMTVKEAAEGYLRSIAKTATKQTLGQYEATLRLFTEHVENKLVGRVTRRDVASFLDEVEQLDPMWGRSPKTKQRSFQEIKRMFGKGPDEIGLSNKTLNRYLTAVGGMWSWAKEREEASGESPTSGLFKPIRGRHSTPFQPYPPELLKALFADPQPDNLLMWELPYVALYSGMRLNEICSLDWSDVKEQDGVTYFDITKAKSEAGVRKVPVHPRLGWLMARREAEGPIWPELKPGGPDGKRSWYFSKRFSVFRKERNIEGPGLKFHSFRKNAVECLERARVPQNEAAEIVGHEKVGITYSVYSPNGLTMKQRLEVIEKITYPCLDGFEMPGAVGAVAEPGRECSLEELAGAVEAA